MEIALSLEIQDFKNINIFRRLIGTVSKMAIELNKIPLVEIDSNGVFKYILIKVHGPEVDGVEDNITILRGYERSTWHADILEEVEAKLHPLDCECIGGGRINHDAAQKKLHVYGYSQAYGKANHEVSARLLKKFYKDYTISISDEGY